jgi:D-sedoheptulose 7-phosphate isomerase
MKIEKFTKSYLNSLSQILKKINPSTIGDIVNLLENTILKKSKVYVIGNGGSCATASHIANDLGTGLKRRKILNLDITSLGDNNSIITALANDIGYKNIFYTQMSGIINPDDVVIAISCSGNSINIIKAVTYAKSIGCKIIGLTGFKGGKLKDLSDINLHINTPEGEYGLVEDAHMILNHIIFSYYIKNQKHA